MITDVLAPSTTVLADAASAAGALTARLLTTALAVGLIVWGVRVRRGGHRVGGVLMIVLGVVLVLGLLSSLVNGTATR